MNVNSIESLVNSNGNLIKYKNYIVNVKNGFINNSNVFYLKGDVSFKGPIVGNFNNISKFTRTKFNAKNLKTSDKVLIIYNIVNYNFLHFIYDTLLPMDFLREIVVKLLRQGKTVKVAINIDVLNKWIKTLGDLNELFDFSFLDKVEIIGMSNIPKNIVYKNIIYFSTRRFRSLYGENYPKYINKAINLANRKFKNKNYWDKIYISRRQRKNNSTICNFDRKLINEDKVSSYFVSQGFKEVWLEDYSFIEKIAILMKSNTIVIQGSATCLLLSMVNNKNIIFLHGPYKLDVFPKEYNKKHRIYKIYGSYNRDMIKIVNIPWSINMNNLSSSWNQINNSLSKPIVITKQKK